MIAIWSNIEAGLGITAGSLATLRPLLRVWLGSNSDSNYSSAFPRRSASRRVGASGQRAVPLGSIDGTNTRDLRPDKLAVMVTNIESQRGVGTNWTRSSSPNSSEEGLTGHHHMNHPMPAKIEVGVHQTFEVTQTNAESDDVEGYHRNVREHV